MKTFEARPVSHIGGTLRVPGDKSISHRAVMFGALASGRTEVTGFLPGEDCLATLAAMQAMGVRAERRSADELTIDGVGLRGLSSPGRALDMGNSGTAMRLFAGLLAGQAFDSRLVGDESLSRRPMERVAVPLRQMGARIASHDGKPPLDIGGGQTLRGIDYAMPVASAQVKSAVLLAGLYAAGRTAVTEPAPSRDHTERMLAAFGQPVTRAGATASLQPAGHLHGTRIAVPGDLSSATFLILAAVLARTGETVIENVGLNPSRTGVLEIFRLMGADIRIEATSEAEACEPMGRLRIRPTGLQGAVIPPALVPLAIDEFPAVFVAAAAAGGDTIVTGATELRHKESDRIATMAAGLRALGIEVEETPDGARIRGGVIGSGTVESHGDHRVAMSFAAASARATGPITILDTANVATSFPGFVSLANRIGMDLRETGQ
jgi:3-phosphoshikimate 1-carboxyvinyltransferase